MNFPELLAALVGMEAGERPEDMFDQLTGAYDNDMGAGGAKIAQLEGELETLTVEVARLKAHNYDLMTAVGASIEGDEGDEPDEPDEGDESPETVENAFETQED